MQCWGTGGRDTMRDWLGHQWALNGWIPWNLWSSSYLTLTTAPHKTLPPVDSEIMLFPEFLSTFLHIYSQAPQLTSFPQSIPQMLFLTALPTPHSPDDGSASPMTLASTSIIIYCQDTPKCRRSARYFLCLKLHIQPPLGCLHLSISRSKTLLEQNQTNSLLLPLNLFLILSPILIDSTQSPKTKTWSIFSLLHLPSPIFIWSSRTVDSTVYVSVLAHSTLSRTPWLRSLLFHVCTFTSASWPPCP